MSPTPTPEPRRLRRSLAVLAVASAFLVAGCARTPVGPTQGVFGSEDQASPTPSVAVPSSAAPTPTPTPTVTPTPTTEPTPTNPWDALSKKTRKQFRGCVDKTVGPGSSGDCALLVVKRLKAAKFYPWTTTSVINRTGGANAILNYQRSRGLVPTGYVKKKTWLALAARTPALPVALPKKCRSDGIIICVDQSHRKLFWMKNGKIVKTVKVRVGGYNYLKKKGQPGEWRVYPTANGTWKVYDKQVDPASENYGSGAMPYSTMFYPDMYVHYSPGFHSVGYAGSSHGCVNVGSLTDAIWIFNHTPIGTRVHIFTLKAA